MANIDVNVTEMTSNCDSLTTIKGENDLNIKGKGTSNNSIKELGIIFFDGLDSYVDSLDLTIDKYKTAMSGYLSSLTGVSSYETSYSPDYPSIGTPGNANTTVTNTEQSGDGEKEDENRDTEEEPQKVKNSKTGNDPGDNDDTNDDVTNTTNSGEAEKPTDPKDTNEDVAGTEGSNGANEPGENNDTNEDVTGTEGSTGGSNPGENQDTTENINTVGPSGGGGTGGGPTRSTESTVDDTENSGSVATDVTDVINDSFDVLKTDDSDEAKTVADLVTASLTDVNHLGDSSNATLLGAVGGAISNISGAGLAGIAGVLGGIGAIAATVAAAGVSSSGSTGGTSLTDVMGDNPNYGGVALSGEMQQFIGGVISGATGISVAELLSGTYPEALETGNNVFNGLMSMFKEAGNLTKEDFAFALSGEPYSFRNLSQSQKEDAFFAITSLVDKYGSIDNLLAHSEEVIEYFQKIGSSYDAVKGLLSMNSQEICDALKGLFDRNNPNIGGIAITPEARDFIKNFLEQFTGMSLEELLNGNHNEELRKAIEALLDMLELYQALGEMSKEEFEKYINDLLKGKFKEVCGINTFTVKSLKSFLGSVGARNRLPFNTFIQNKVLLQSALSEFSGLKEELRGMHSIDEPEIQDALRTLFSSGRFAAGGMQIGNSSKMTVKFMLDAVCKYHNMPFEELLNNTEHATLIYSYIYELYKYMSFIKMFNTLKINDLQSRVIRMFQGKQLGLLGFSSDQIGTIKNTIETFCKEKNLRVRGFLNNVSSFPVVVNLLEGNDAFKRLTIIFDEISGLPLLVILFNLIESWKEDFKDRMNNVISFLNRKRLEKITSSVSDKVKESIKVANKDNLVNLVNSMYDKSDDELLKLLDKIFKGEKNDIESDASGMCLCYLIKLYLFGLSSYYNISVEDLLKDARYNNYIKYLLKYVPNYYDYIKYEDLFNDKYLFRFFNDLYVGKYPLLLGMTADYLVPIEREYVTIANYKNLNIKVYLSNNMYANEVANVMKKNPQSFFMSFFGDKNDYVLQKIIYNIFSNYRR